MAPKVKKVGDLVQIGRELEVMERPEKELKKFEGRRKLLRKMIGKEGGGNMKKMTPKLQKKMEEIMEELGMMSPRIKPVKKKDGGLAAAIEKVKKEDAVKMKAGGMAPRRNGMASLAGVIDEFVETMEPFQGTLKKGETLRNVGGKTMVVRRMPNPDIVSESGRMMSDADRARIAEMMGARRMENGGKVPPKFKGFSKLPEDVQEQMNPTLAKKFKKGGPVKFGSGGGVCRGMGAARAGGKFKLR
tara:strand:+ start:617 stop:1351 length:735 start_codon:yes stop_codon:yes gene_type:complete